MSAAHDLTPSLKKGARAWLEARGLDSDLCERLGLTSRPGRDGKGEIVVPYERNGELVYSKVRTLDPKGFYREPKGGAPMFWREDAITDPGLADQPIIITEGELDAISAIQAGFWRTISVPDGAPKNAMVDGRAAPDDRASGKYAFLDAALAAMESTKEIIIAADNDAPGHALLSDLSALLGPARCKFVRYPGKCKDLNEVLRDYGVDGVRACLEDAQWIRIVGVRRFEDLPPLPPLAVWRPDVHQPIDDLIPICPGQVSVWTGIPGSGKSALLNAVAWSIARRDGIRIAHGTFEAAPQREYFEDCVGFMHGVPHGEASQAQLAATRRFLQEQTIFLMSDGFASPGEEEFFDADLDWFFDAARAAIVRFGCRIVILDPWSQIEHSRPAHEQETTYVQKAIRRARSFARTFDVHVAIIAHPTKQRKLEDGTYAMPEGYEISGSAHWFNGVDMGVTIHRAPPLTMEEQTVTDKHGNPMRDDRGNIIRETTGEWIADPKSTRVLIRVWKKKNHRIMGKPGDAYASFSSSTNRYTSAETWEDRIMPKTYRAPRERNDD